MRMMALMALTALTSVGLILSGFSQASAAPANLAAIERAASASSPVGEARCWIHRWCGPNKCHRRLWCR